MRGGTLGGVELRQAVEGLIREVVLRPILTQRAKVAVEGAILLRQKYDVIDCREAHRI